MIAEKDIRARRLRLGLRQRDVASEAGISPIQLRRWERGLAVPDVASARRIASILQVSTAQLLESQRAFVTTVVPGEGYTTSPQAGQELFLRRLSPPSGKKRVFDLFCGCGGLSFGFEQSGKFVTTAGIDLLRDRIDSFLANHRFANAVAGDVRACSLRTLASHIGPIDVLVGGPPCQGFSSIRPFRVLTEGDPRNSLIEHYVLILEHLRPEWFVFENVVGILTHENGSRLRALLDATSAIGYRVDWRVLNAAHFGVPQHRERLLIVGNLAGTEFKWPIPSHFVEYKSMAGKRPEVLTTIPLFSSHLLDPVTVMQAIGDLPHLKAGEEVTHYDSEPLTSYQKMMRKKSRSLTLHAATRHSARMLEIIRHAGKNRSALPAGLVRSGFSSCYSRLDADKPSTTLTVNFVHPASNRCIHPTQDRALTPREGARLQSFPDHFEFVGTSAQIVKQIGNAVPPLLGEALANAIVQSEWDARRRHNVVRSRVQALPCKPLTRARIALYSLPAVDRGHTVESK